MKTKTSDILIFVAIILTIFGMLFSFLQDWRNAAGIWSLTAMCLWARFAINDCN